MTNRELEIKFYEALLPVYGDKEAKSLRQYLFSALHGLPQYKWLLHRHEEVWQDLKDRVEEAIPLLVNHMPVQYVLGKAWFCDLELMVAPGVLIPRPETELLIAEITEKHRAEASLNILDIGTGSGAIAVTLAKRMKNSPVTAIDISEKALTIAATNAKNNNVSIEFIKMDILDEAAHPKLPQFNIIVSNPPYVKESEKSLMKRNVLDYEPAEALFVTDANPLLFYRTIARFAKMHLLDSGELWLEINESESTGVKSLMMNNGFTEIQVYKDFNGKDRIVSAIIRVNS